MKSLHLPCLAVLVFITSPLQAALYSKLIPAGSYGNLSQFDMHVYPSMACGPASSANALAYMWAANPNHYSSLLPSPDYPNLVSLGDTLAGPGYMATDSVNGTWHDNLITAMFSYIEAQSPGSTTYEAQDAWSWSHQVKPTWTTLRIPQWSMLYESLLEEDAIEILFTYPSGGGHFVTVSGLQWNDMDDDLIIDSSESALLYFVNPRTGASESTSIWQSSLNGRIETGYSSSWISTVFAISVPEPSALLFLLCAAMTVASRPRT